MKKVVLAVLAAGCLVTSCDFFSKNQKNTDRDYDILNEQDLESEGFWESIPEDIPSQPQIVRPDIVDSKGSIDIYKYADQDVHVEIPSIGYTHLTAGITSGELQTEVRFEEILLPEGRDLLPFDREIHYDLPQDGIYTLIIRSDTLNRVPRNGFFTLDFDLR